MSTNSTLLIGVDGGATEVKAHAVDCDDLDAPRAFDLRSEAASRVYVRHAEFTPAPVAQQLAERDAGALQITAAEREQARAWIAAAAEAIRDVAVEAGAQRVLVGMGMPGLKTADQRGIAAINNGPRCPTFLDDLEDALGAAGVALAAPIAALGSDADYCGLGEQHARDGLFRDVTSAYYVGCGTGIADAMKLGGQLVPFDAAKAWIQKSWQMPSALGPTFEKLVSAKSLNAVYDGLRAGWCGPLQPDRGTEFPELASAAGHPAAQAWLHAAALVLAELIFERLWTIRNGRAAAAHRGEAYVGLETEHPHRGVLLERVIIGQRLGELYAAAQHRPCFADPLDAMLARMIADGGDEELREHSLSSSGDRLKSGFLIPSKLRAAPALGAAVAATMVR